MSGAGRGQASELERATDIERVGERRAWYVYDFANSAFASTVLTLLLGPYIVSVAQSAADASGMVRPFGFAIAARSWWSYIVSASVMLQVLVLPLIGAVADRTSRKTRLLAACAYTGAFSTMMLFFVEGQAYLLGGLLFVIANVAFGASIVVYNSFLPYISTAEERDTVSSRGWGFGYLGGGLALAVNLLLFAKAGALGISQAMAVRINLALAGVWWALFALYPIMRLRDRPVRETAGLSVTYYFGQFVRTVKGMRRYPQTLTFLIAYLLYNDAVQAVIALSGQFGSDELKIPMGTLALAILMVQFVAFVGALVFNAVAKILDAKRAIAIALVIWTATLIFVYVSVRNTSQFFAMAAVVGLIMGGTQALSRSLFSQLIPPGKEAEYFSVYELSDKGTSWLAPLFFGITLQMTGSFRTAITSLIVFFIAGFLLLLTVQVRKGVEDARSL